MKMENIINLSVSGTYKRILSLIMIIAFLIPLFSFLEVSALNIGDEIGNVLNTDIKTYIDEHRIPSYNINNKSAVLVKDLSNYGFDTVYDDQTRSTSITYNPNKKFTPITEFEENTKKSGSIAFKYVYTDIVAYINNKKVESFNVKGNLAIFFGDLQDYGKFAYDNKERVSSFTLSQPIEAVTETNEKRQGNSQSTITYTTSNINNSSQQLINQNSQSSDVIILQNSENTDNNQSSNNISSGNTTNNANQQTSNPNPQFSNAPVAQNNSNGTYYTVKFDLNYINPQGSIPSQSVRSGGYASRPSTENVKRENYLLTGWYTDKDCKNKFLFSMPINRDITLYAKWFFYDDTLVGYEDYEQVRDMVLEINEKYYNILGNIDYKDFDRELSEVCEFVQNLYEQDKILGYDYTVGNDAIGIKLKDGTIYVHTPQNKQLLSSGNGIQITSYRPYKSSLLDSFDDSFTPLFSTFQTIPKISEWYISAFESSDYSANHTEYSNSEVDINTLNNMSGNIILWEGHGSWISWTGSILWTSIKNVEGELIIDDKGHYGITHAFINSLEGKPFDNALIYLNTCSSLKGINTKTNLLADAFINKGARAVIGNNDTINTVYARYLLDDIMMTFLKINESTNDFYTVKEAVNLIVSSEKMKKLHSILAGSGNATCYPQESDFTIGELLTVKSYEIKKDGITYYRTPDGGIKVTGVYEERNSYSIYNTIEHMGKEYKVTEIADNAFVEVKGAKIDYLSANLEKIGEYAFVNMDLSECEFPSTVKYIGFGAFDGAILPKKITLNGSSSIGRSAFRDVRNLETLNIGKYVQLDIDFANYFSCRDLKEVIVDKDNPIYQSIDGVLYSGSALCIYPAKRTGEKYTVVDGTVTIKTCAFYMAELTDVVLPKSVSYIEWSAFEMCNNLKSIDIKNSKAEIDNKAIVKNSDHEIIIYGDENKPNSVEQFVDDYNKENSDHIKKLVFITLGDPINENDNGDNKLCSIWSGRFPEIEEEDLKNIVIGSPYYINSAEELAYFTTIVEKGISFKNVNVILNTNIDLSSSQWKPIGTDEYPFEGNFYGQGHTITGLNIGNNNQTLSGLFGKIVVDEKKYINNLTLKNIDVNTEHDTVHAGMLVGELVVEPNSEIEIDNCQISGDIVLITSRNTSYVGGLIGRADLKSNAMLSISNSKTSGNFTISPIIGIVSLSSSYGGGLIARTLGEIDGNIKIISCFSDAVIDVSSSPNIAYGGSASAGGLIGKSIHSVEIQLSTFIGTAKAHTQVGWNTQSAYAGGLIGDIEFNGNSLIVQNSYVNANLVATTNKLNYNIVGGIIGGTSGIEPEYAIIKNCYATGTTSASFTAGIIGQCSSDIQITNCYFDMTSFKISPERLKYLADSWTAGVVTTKTTNSRGMTTEEMKQKNSFTEWDFEKIWAIDENINNGYPYFKNTVGNYN